MPIGSYKMGPGTLTLGAGGDLIDVSLQVTNGRVEPAENVKSTDAVPVLGGDELPAEESADYTYRLRGTVLQDLTAGAVLDWTWSHAGEEVAFAFVPNTAAAREVTGTCRVVPLTIGGAVSKTERPTSDFDYAIVGEPVFGAAV
jgi:hypothetical protein